MDLKREVQNGKFDIYILNRQVFLNLEIIILSSQLA